MKVRCDRCNTEFTAKIRVNRFHQNNVIDCPGCGRGYGQKADGTWYCDRPLIIL